MRIEDSFENDSSAVSQHGGIMVIDSSFYNLSASIQSGNGEYNIYGNFVNSAHFIRDTGFVHLKGLAQYIEGCNPICTGCKQRQLTGLVKNTSFATLAVQNTHSSDEFVLRQLIANDSLMHMGTTYDKVLTQFYDSLSTATIGQIIQIENLSASGNTSGALALTKRITPENIVVSNIISLDSIYINTALSTFSRYSTQQEDSILFAIAHQCPMIGGRAVYQARALLSFLKDSVVTFPDNCPSFAIELARMKQTDNGGDPDSLKNNSAFKLYPNPNNGNMTLEYNVTGNKAEFVLYDITGKLVNSYNLNVKASVLQIVQAELSNGIYYYQIRVDDKVVKYDKIVIIN
jgi:hypothetical protein